MQEPSMTTIVLPPHAPAWRVSKMALYGLLLLALVAAPFAGAYPVFVLKVLCFALFACAFNLLIGYAGLLSFGHAAFLGVAGYVAGHAMKAWAVTPEAGLALGTGTGALIGLLMGALAIRRHGIYFSMITAHKDLRYFHTSKIFGSGIDRRCEQLILKGIKQSRSLIV